MGLKVTYSAPTDLQNTKWIVLQIRVPSGVIF